MQATDAELIARITAGDSSAVAELYDRFAPMLFPMVLRVVREKAEAEDVLHDAFVAVSERATLYVPARGSVVAWLVTLVRNLAIDRTRRRARRSALAHRDALEAPISAVESPEEALAEARASGVVRRALASLPDVQRQTLEIAFYEGLSYPEIADREGVPLGTVKSRAARALQALREALAKEGMDL